MREKFHTDRIAAQPTRSAKMALAWAGISGAMFLSACSGAADPPADDAAGTDQQVMAILRSNGCASCHTVDGKSVGPSMTAITVRYGDDIANVVTASIANGSQNKWGGGRMSPQPNMTTEQVDSLISALENLRAEAAPATSE